MTPCGKRGHSTSKSDIPLFAQRSFTGREYLEGSRVDREHGRGGAEEVAVDLANISN